MKEKRKKRKKKEKKEKKRKFENKSLNENKLPDIFHALSQLLAT